MYQLNAVEVERHVKLLQTGWCGGFCFVLFCFVFFFNFKFHSVFIVLITHDKPKRQQIQPTIYRLFRQNHDDFYLKMYSLL